MTFRTRVAVFAAVVVAIAVMLACGVAWKGARDALIGSADSSLTGAYNADYAGGPTIAPAHAPGFGLQIVSSEGEVLLELSAQQLPVDSTEKAIAAGTERAQYRTIGCGEGSTCRELIVPIPAGTAVLGFGIVTTPAALVLVEPFQGIEDRLHSLGIMLVLVALLGVLLAAVLGWVAARAAIVPLTDTTKEIEAVAATLDVSHRVEAGAHDELGRLRHAFNRLLEEVERSQDAQRQLILDASHELRTPLTSLRANAQVLGRLDELDGDDVTQLSEDMVTQVDELTRLVGDLTELTRGVHSVEAASDLDLDDLVGECVEIAEVHGRPKRITIDVDLDQCTVHAKRARLVRAIGNLLDNAIKFSPEGGSIAVTCRAGTVTVEDSGPGIDWEDAPHVFDRFYRSPRDRGLPGSGLGLAIVAQVTSEAGGSVDVLRSERLGGTRIVLRLPVVA